MVRYPRLIGGVSVLGAGVCFGVLSISFFACRRQFVRVRRGLGLFDVQVNLNFSTAILCGFHCDLSDFLTKIHIPMWFCFCLGGVMGFFGHRRQGHLCGT